MSGGRTLGLGMATALVVGNIIGMGIFLMPASLAPYGLNALTGWAVTVVGCLCVALVYATLARRFPSDDGPYDYTLRAFGPATAFVAMWCYWVSVWVANAAIALGVVGYLMYFVPQLQGTPFLAPVSALALVWLFVLVNLRGARTAGWVQVLTTVLKVLPQVAVILLGLWILVRAPHRYAEHVPATPASLRAVAAVSTLTLFAMLGIECAAIPAARVRDPQRNIPRATLIGTLVAAFLYIGISVVPLFLIPQQALAQSTAPFADLFERVLAGQWGGVFAVFVVISGVGALNGWTLVVGEVTGTLARHGTFPQWLSRENSHGAPARAFVLSGVVSSLILLVSYAGSVAQLFETLTTVAVYLTIPVYITSAIAVARLKRLDGQAPTVAIAAAALLAVLYCLWLLYGVRPLEMVLGVALTLAGIPVYVACTRAARRRGALQAQPGT
ncbi:MAG TPA: amino acid permease [Steroidobacteraceae bacterium]|nr:amino acid permease [Steroidobacteraceae bacterium]